MTACGSHKDFSGKKVFRNYTLVELLMVIAIISILSAMLMPALNSAKQASYAMACSCNLKQMCMAWSMYADQNKGWLAPYLSPLWYRNPEYTRLCGKEYGVDPDAQPGKEHLRCPSSISDSFTIGVNYFNVFGETGHPNLNRRNGRKLSKIEPTTFLQGDADYAYIKTDDVNTLSELSTPAWNGASFRHSDGINFSFSDCHVKKSTKQEVVLNWTVFKGPMIRP
jgi:prepilin-type N-terminal cleavage/methylation domain-containing protein/prepilin-type processing-associated H-X9-DG protein